MSYIQDNLRSDEQVILKAKFNPLSLLGAMIKLAIGIFIGVMIMGWFPGHFAQQIDWLEGKSDIQAMAPGIEIPDEYWDELKEQHDATWAEIDGDGVDAWYELKSLEWEGFNGELILNVFNAIGWVIIAGSALSFAIKALKLFTYQLAVTNKRVLGKTGIISLHAIDVPIEKVDSVHVSAGALGNILHSYKFYVITTASAGVSATSASKKDTFFGISNANELKNTILAAIEQHAEEARKAQAAEIAAAMAQNNAKIAQAQVAPTTPANTDNE